MLQKYLAALGIICGLLMLCVPPAMANFIRTATVTATCTSYTITVAGGALKQPSVSWTVQYTLTLTPTSGTPIIITNSIPVVPDPHLDFSATLTQPLGPLAGDFTLSGSATLIASNGKIFNTVDISFGDPSLSPLPYPPPQQENEKKEKQHRGEHAHSDYPASPSASMPHHNDKHSGKAGDKPERYNPTYTYTTASTISFNTISCGSAPPDMAVLASCVPTSSLSVLIQGQNVSSYIPRSCWNNGGCAAISGVSLVQVEGTDITPTVISTPNPVNACASNSVTGQTVCTANNTDVYLLSSSTLTATLTSAGTGSVIFSGGDCTNCAVTINPVTNKALIALNTSNGPGFQFLDLAGTPTFEPPIVSPAGHVGENILIDPIRNLVLSPTEFGNYELIDISSATPTFFENTSMATEVFDSAAADCTTGIALASDEFTNQIFIADLTQATFTPGAPGTWSAPSQLQLLGDFPDPLLTGGIPGIAVASGAHIGVVVTEFGGSAFGAIQLPAASGSGTPVIADWVKCDIPDHPTGVPWRTGLDPHVITAYVSPNTGDAMALITNAPSPADATPGVIALPPNSLAVIDLTKLLNPTIVPRLSGTHACDPSIDLVLAGVVRFIEVP